MKNFFFILLMFFCMSQSLTAQIEHPKASSIEVGKVFCLYNRNYHGFLVGGNNYNTQASLSGSYAFKIVLEKYVDEKGEWDGKTYFITDSVEMGDYRGVYRKMFVESNQTVYMDQNEQGGTKYRDNLWTISLIEGKESVYRITPSSRNRNHEYENKQLGVLALSASTLPVVGLYEPINGRDDYEWCFVTCEEQKRYFDRKHNKRISAKQRVIDSNAAHINIPDEQVVYMLNVDYEGFLIGGNLYNTQASLSKTDAHKVILHKYVDVDGIWDGKSYYITDSVRSGSYSGKYRNMYIAQDGFIWIDQSEEKSGHMDCVWEIIPSTKTSSICYIRPSEKNNVFKSSAMPDFYLGGRVHADYRELPTLELVKGRNENYTKWAFITENQWKQLESIERKEELQRYFSIITAMYPNVDLSYAQQVYEDIDAPLSDVEDQIGKMRLILFSNGNQNKDGVDFTSLIKNADFEGTGGLGWNMPFDVKVGSLTWRGGDEQNHCAEAYQAIFEFYQEIAGIPNGLYRVDLQGFCRTRGADLAWLERDSSLVVPEFYANKISLPINNLMHKTFLPDEKDFDFLNSDMPKHLSNWAESKWLCMDGTYALNNMHITSLAFSKGYFDQSLYCVVDKGRIKIGIRGERKKSGSWVAWDNFRLTYLSETMENYKEGIRCHLNKAMEIEKMAKHRGIDISRLSESITRTQQVLQTENIDSMRKSISSINYYIGQTRNMLEEQEFGEVESDSVSSYWEAIENRSDMLTRLERTKRQAEQDSLKRILDNADSYLYMGDMVDEHNKLLAKNHFQKAFDVYVSLPVDYSVLHLDICVRKLTFSYVEMGQYDEAVVIWKRLIERLELSKYQDNRNKIAEAYYEIGGILLWQKKDYQQAEDVYNKSRSIVETLYKKAIEFTDKFEQERLQSILSFICNEFAYALAYQKRYNEALELVERAIILQPDVPYFYDSKGEFLYMKGDKDGAVEMWKKVIELEPDFPKMVDSQLYKYLFRK